MGPFIGPTLETQMSHLETLLRRSHLEERDAALPLPMGNKNRVLFGNLVTRLRTVN